MKRIYKEEKMKKNFLTFALMICFILPCAILLSACGGKDPEDPPTISGIVIEYEGEKSNSISLGSYEYYADPIPDSWSSDFAFYYEMSDGSYVDIPSMGSVEYYFNGATEAFNGGSSEQGRLIGSWERRYKKSVDGEDYYASVWYMVTQTTPTVSLSFDENDPASHTYSYPSVPQFDVGINTHNDHSSPIYEVYYAEGTKTQVDAKIASNEEITWLSWDDVGPGTYCAKAFSYSNTENSVFNGESETLEFTMEAIQINLKSNFDEILADRLESYKDFYTHSLTGILTNDSFRGGWIGMSGSGYYGDARDYVDETLNPEFFEGQNPIVHGTFDIVFDDVDAGEVLTVGTHDAKFKFVADSGIEKWFAPFEKDIEIEVFKGVFDNISFGEAPVESGIVKRSAYIDQTPELFSYIGIGTYVNWINTKFLVYEDTGSGYESCDPSIFNVVENKVYFASPVVGVRYFKIELADNEFVDFPSSLDPDGDGIIFVEFTTLASN